MGNTQAAITEGPFATAEEARAAAVLGWNLRCNRCGQYGATWIPKMRPGWGSLALCRPHAVELDAEQNRHGHAMRALVAVNFEQDRRPPLTPARVPGTRRPA